MSVGWRVLTAGLAPVAWASRKSPYTSFPSGPLCGNLGGRQDLDYPAHLTAEEMWLTEGEWRGPEAGLQRPVCCISAHAAPNSRRGRGCPGAQRSGAPGQMLPEQGCGGSVPQVSTLLVARASPTTNCIGFIFMGKFVKGIYVYFEILGK